MKQFAILTVAVCLLTALGAYGKPPAAQSDADAICANIAAAPNDPALLQELKTYISKTTDTDEKARLAAIYCLGCLYTKQTQEANSVAAYLKKNFPSHPSTAWLSDGSLRDTCGKCEGSGKVEQPCTYCGGSGECRTCRGQGSRDVPTFSGSEYRKCGTCNGTGKCTHCSGTGKTRTTCPACGGSGGSISQAKIKSQYFAALNRAETQPELQKSRAVTPPSRMPNVDLSGMDEVFSKRLQSYARAFKENRLDDLIFDAKWEIEERDTKRRGWSKYERQARQFLELAKAEKVRQKKVEEANTQARAEAARPFDEERERLIANMTPAQKAIWSQSLPPMNATPEQRLADVQRIIREDEERQKRDSQLEAKLADVRAVSADFDKVLFDPQKYEGKVLASTTQLTGVMPPLYVVLHGLGLSEDQMVPSTMALCEKAIKILQIKGEHAVVAIRYTVQQGKLVLLDITIP